MSPLQPRLGWQLWFAATASAEDDPWQLLHADPQVRSLFALDPSGDQPPSFIRIMHYRYRLAAPGALSTWTRELEGYWLPPLPADDILRDAMKPLGYAQ